MIVFARCIGVAALPCAPVSACTAAGAAAPGRVCANVGAAVGAVAAATAAAIGIDGVVCAVLETTVATGLAAGTPPASSFLTLSIICCVSNGLSMWSSTCAPEPFAASNGFCFDDRKITGVVGEIFLISLQRS